MEQLAPIQVVGVVSCRADVDQRYLKRGYKIERSDMITDHILKEHLTRSYVDFCIMVKNTSYKTFPKTIGMSKELEHELASIMENIFKE